VLPATIPPTRANPTFYGVLGVTLAAYVASGVTGYLALQQHGIVQDQCVTERQFCSAGSGIDAASNARSYAWASTIPRGRAVAGTVALFLIPSRLKVEPAQAARALGLRGW